VEPEGGINIYYKWDDPYAGYCCDEMRLHGKDELHVTTHLTVGTEDHYSYRVIYWREGTSGSGEDLPPVPLKTLLRRTASRVAGALGVKRASKPVAQRLSQEGRKGPPVDGLDGQSSDSNGNHGNDRRPHDSSNHGHDRRPHDSSKGGKPRRLRPFERVEEL